MMIIKVFFSVFFLALGIVVADRRAVPEQSGGMKPEGGTTKSPPK